MNHNFTTQCLVYLWLWLEKKNTYVNQFTNLMVAKQNILFPKNHSFQDFGRETGTNIPYHISGQIEKKKQQVGKPTNNGGGRYTTFCLKGFYEHKKTRGVDHSTLAFKSRFCQDTSICFWNCWIFSVPPGFRDHGRCFFCQLSMILRIQVFGNNLRRDSQVVEVEVCSCYFAPYEVVFSQ